MKHLEKSHSLKSTPPPLAKTTDTTIQPLNRMMYFKEDQNMMKQDLEFLGINQIDNFPCVTKGECPCRILISELIRISISISELQSKIETQDIQQSYTSACLARLGFPIDEQSLKDYQDYSCGNHYNS